MRKLLAFIPWILLVVFKLSDLATTLHGLPDGLSAISDDLREIVMPLNQLELGLLIVGAILLTYVFWPEIRKRLPVIGETAMGNGDDRSIRNTGHVSGVLNTGDGATFNLNQPLELTEEIVEDILSGIDHSKPVAVASRQDGKSRRLANQLKEILAERGFNVLTSNIEIGVISGMNHETPISIYSHGLPFTSGGVQTIFIDANLK